MCSGHNSMIGKAESYDEVSDREEIKKKKGRIRNRVKLISIIHIICPRY